MKIEFEIDFSVFAVGIVVTKNDAAIMFLFMNLYLTWNEEERQNTPAT